MAPEHEAQPRAFYDHESDAPHRRRRPAADWGVGEDIFDRMPSRRFKRSDRRAEHREGEERVEHREGEQWVERREGEQQVERRAEPPAGGERPARRADEWATSSWDDATGRRRGESMTIVIGRDESAPEARRIVVETDDFKAIKPARTDTSEFAAVRRGDTDEFVGVEPLGRDGESRRPEPAPRDEAAEDRWAELDGGAVPEPGGRRTIKISGHPDRLPVVRTQRPPRTVVERLGTSPDRIAAYAVALGFLLVLIAVLTTGQ